MLEYQEGLLTFKFPEEYVVSKYDDSQFYQNNFKKLPETKEVDFVIVKNSQQIVLIEVKDFRNSRIENKQRLSSGDLMIEVAQKVRDTLAGLYVSALTHKDKLKEIYTTLFYSPLPQIEVVLFLEEDPPNNSRIHTSHKRSPSQLEKLKKVLKPFGVRCRIYSRSTLPSNCEWNVA